MATAAFRLANPMSLVTRAPESWRPSARTSRTLNQATTCPGPARHAVIQGFGIACYAEKMLLHENSAGSHRLHHSTRSWGVGLLWRAYWRRRSVRPTASTPLPMIPCKRSTLGAQSRRRSRLWGGRQRNARLPGNRKPRESRHGDDCRCAAARRADRLSVDGDSA